MKYWLFGQGIWSRTRLWLLLQPVFSLCAFVQERGALLIETSLVLLGVLVAVGAESEATRGRMEYLWQLPWERRALQRTRFGVACGTLLAVSAFHWLAEVTGVLQWIGRNALASLLQDELSRPTTWEHHAFRWPWLNLVGLPLLPYAAMTKVLRGRRQCGPPLVLSPALYWSSLLVVLLMALYAGLGAVIEGQVPSHDLFWRNVPGLVSIGLALCLLESLARRTERLGIDSYPVEQDAWDS